MKSKVLLSLAATLMLAIAIGLVYAEEGSNSNDSESNSGSDDKEDSDNELEAESETEIEVEKENEDGKSETRIKTKIKDEIGELKQEYRERIKDGEVRIEFKERFEAREDRMRKILEFKERLRKHNGKIDVEGRNITIKELTDEQKAIIAGRINAKTGLNLTAEDIDNKTLLRAYLSNGRFAYVKVMPDRASIIALQRLRAKCVQHNCTVELKEVGNGNKSRLAYVIETEKNSTFLFFLKNKMIVKAEVDAETGEIISIKKPWWAIMAKEKNENEEEIEAEVESEGNVETESEIEIEEETEIEDEDENETNNQNTGVQVGADITVNTSLKL